MQIRLHDSTFLSDDTDIRFKSFHDTHDVGDRLLQVIPDQKMGDPNRGEAISEGVHGFLQVFHGLLV